MSVKAEQSEATRERLIAVAREHFARGGYGAAGTERIVQEAGVTRGALYHHFHSKEGLFRAVLEEVHTEVGRRVLAEAEAAPGPWEALLAGCRAFLAAATAPDVQRIMLLDGPAVLGWASWRELDARHSMKELREHLRCLMENGVIRAVPLEALTHLVSGALNEAALWIAAQENVGAALEESVKALKVMLGGLKVEVGEGA